MQSLFRLAIIAGLCCGLIQESFAAGNQRAPLSGRGPKMGARASAATGSGSGGGGAGASKPHRGAYTAVSITSNQTSGTRSSSRSVKPTGSQHRSLRQPSSKALPSSKSPGKAGPRR